MKGDIELEGEMGSEEGGQMWVGIMGGATVDEEDADADGIERDQDWGYWAGREGVVGFPGAEICHWMHS